MDDPKVRISNNALSSVAAALRPKTEEEVEQGRAFYAMVDACVLKAEGHTQLPASAHFDGLRLYTVTTIAQSARYGGVRTPVICDSFRAATEIVEKNYGDIFETSYMLAVIEAVAANRLYTHLDEAYWYRWEGTYQDGGYKPIETPAAYARQTVQPLG